MAVAFTLRPLFTVQRLPNAAVLLYQSPGGWVTRIDALSVTNTDTVPHTVSIYLVPFSLAADATTPPAPSIAAARKAPRGELRRYPYGHFAIYHDPRVKADQVEFLRRVVGG